MPDRRNRYPFDKNYARRSGLIIAFGIATLLLITYPNRNPSLYENTIFLSAASALATFAVRFMRFRKISGELKVQGRIVVAKDATPESSIVKVFVVALLFVLVLVSIASIRVVDPVIWLSALFGYILGLNAGELSYYLFIRNFENSSRSIIYTFDSEDPTTRMRITGYRLERNPD